MRDNRSGLLAQSDLVKALHLEAGAQCSRCEHLVDGHDAGAADAREENVLRAGERSEIGVCDDGRGGTCGLGSLLARYQFDGHERRAIAVHAGVIGVAGRLVDLRLAAVLGVHGLDREAVRLHTAVTAAFAHCLVDDDASVASGSVPRLRWRRASAAQCWS